MTGTAPADLVMRCGGRYASEPGIDPAAPDAGERFKALVREGLRLRRQAPRRHSA